MSIKNNEAVSLNNNLSDNNSQSNNELFINQRLKIIRKNLSLTQNNFAKELGMSQPGYAQIEKGNRKVNNRLIKLICVKFDINENWLRTGNGKIKQTNNITVLNIKNSTLTDSEIKFIQQYLNLSIKDKILINDIIKRLNNDYE